MKTEKKKNERKVTKRKHWFGKYLLFCKYFNIDMVDDQNFTIDISDSKKFTININDASKFNININDCSVYNINQQQCTPEKYNGPKRKDAEK